MNMAEDTRQMLDLEAREDGGEVLEGYGRERLDELHMLYGTRGERAELARLGEALAPWPPRSRRLAAVVGGVEVGYRMSPRPYVCALVTWRAALAGGGPGVFSVVSWHLSLRNAEARIRHLFRLAERGGYALCVGAVAVRPAEGGRCGGE